MDQTTASRRFEFTYRITVPAQRKSVRIWVPVPSADADQDILRTTFEFSSFEQMEVNAADGNRILFIELPPIQTNVAISLSFDVLRRRRSSRAPSVEPYSRTIEDLGLSRYLKADSRVPIEGQFGEEARAVVSQWERSSKSAAFRSRESGLAWGS